MVLSEVGLFKLLKELILLVSISGEVCVNTISWAYMTTLKDLQLTTAGRSLCSYNIQLLHIL